MGMRSDCKAFCCGLRAEGFGPVVAPASMVAMFALVLICSVAQAAGTDDDARLTLASRGHSPYKIYLEPRARRVTRKAASELQDLIRKAAGATLPIVNEAQAGDRLIVLGDSERGRRAGVTSEGLPRDGFHMRVVGHDLYLVGRDEGGRFFRLNTNRSTSGGSYFAMVWFARHHMGVGWYMPGPLGAHIPGHDTLTIPADMDETQAPRYVLRALAGTHSWSEKDMRRQRRAGAWSTDFYDPDIIDQSVKWGRHMMLGNDVNLTVGHAWYKWIPADHPTSRSPQAYGRTHPEFYAVRDGERQNHYYNGHHGGQLDVSNPEVARVYADNIIAYASKTGRRSFSLSPNDGSDTMGNSPSERVMDEAPGWQGKPRMSNRIIRFANEVATRVTDRIPDAVLGLYAYSAWKQPPSPGLEVNESIFISDVYNGLPYRYNAGRGARARIAQQIDGWRTAVPNVMLTSYYTGYGNWSLPWSTPDVLGWLNDRLRAHDSSRGMWISYVTIGTPMIGSLGADPWVAARLMWNPDQSVRRLEDQFYNGAFGAEAGPLIKEYYHEINRAMHNAIAAHPYESSDSAKQYVVPAYSAVRPKARALIDRAVEAVEDMPADYRWRVDRVARAWRLAELTVDAIQANSRAQSLTGDRRQRMLRQARKLAADRRHLIRDPESRFAISPRAVEKMDRKFPLGIARPDAR